MIINDELMAKAKKLSGLKEKTAVVHAGLEALIAAESARRLADMQRREWVVSDGAGSDGIWSPRDSTARVIRQTIPV